MAFRNLFISSKAFVRSFQKKIKLEKEGIKPLEIPFEDLGAVVIDNKQVVITAHTLQSIAENNSSLFICNDSHLPIGVFLPFQNHSRQAKQIKKQVSISNSLRGKIWQTIVRQKIDNQSLLLKLLSHEGEGERLANLLPKVTMHDKTNREGYASALYFSTLFGNGFSRRTESKTNSALNYAYSIIRGIIARNIAAFGLIPAIGVHHKNEYNNFNLADDFIEPYRPFVDYFVRVYLPQSNDASLSKSERASLFDILQMEVNFNGKMYSLETSIEQVIKSFVAVINKKDTEELLLPRLDQIKRKYYG